ncbi:MAG: hypothetical protein ACRBFS_22955 [Aureispira sp.]
MECRQEGEYTAYWRGTEHRNQFLIVHKNASTGVTLYYFGSGSTNTDAVNNLNTAWTGKAGLTYEEFCALDISF